MEIYNNYIYLIYKIWNLIIEDIYEKKKQENHHNYIFNIFIV